ncbi:MAG: hypothetical protein AMXMBFR47_25980 [Planctomycetota bacterium]
MAIPRDPMEENLRALEELENAGSREKRGNAGPQRPAPPPAGDSPAKAPPPARAGPPAVPVPPRNPPIPEEAFPDVPETPPPPQSTDYGPTRPRRNESTTDRPRLGPRRRPVGHAPNTPPSGTPGVSGPPPGEIPDYHCLNCGYGLFRAVSLRCSECGEIYDEETLRTWFDGAEEERLRQLNWFIYPILVLKVWMLPSIVGLIDFGCFNWLLFAASAGMSIWALSLLVGDRRGTIGGYYAVAGMFAAGMLLFVGFFGGTDFRNTFVSPAVLFGLDAVCASLLLLTLLHPPDDSKLWNRRPASILALCVAVSAPPVGAVLGKVEVLIRQNLQVNFPSLSASPIFATLLMAILAVGMWIYVRQWLAGFRKRVYPKIAADS